MNSKRLAICGVLALVAFVAVGATEAMADDWGFSFSYGSGGSYYGSYGYGYTPHYHTPGYSPSADYYGRYEGGAGRHSSGFSSPYRHSTHHGYHNSPEQSWHGGSHWGHN